MLSPVVGNRGEKVMSDIETSYCLGVILFTLPGVLCSMSLLFAQLNSLFEFARNQSKLLRHLQNH